MNLNTVYIIGCGGVGSWLAPSMDKLIPDDTIVVIDGDKLERSNLNHQLFGDADIGRNKANVLGQRYNLLVSQLWFAQGVIDHPHPADWLMVCADNDPCRLAALDHCDEHQCQAIIAANETNSAEAYYYRSYWRDTERDPRVYYPQLRTNHDNDPRAAAIGCTGVFQEQNRQLVSANFMAAALAQWLFVLWAMKVPDLDPEAIDSLPYKLVANMSLLETFKLPSQPVTA